MKPIKITVTGANALVTEKPAITSGTVGLPVEFTFDEAWDGLSKTAVFRAGSRSYPVSCVQSTAIVPWEVLEKGGVGLYIGVFGADEKGTVKIPTVWACVDTIAAGAQIPETVPAEPTPNVYDQILTAVSKAVETANSVRQDADSGKFIGPAGPKGDAGAIDFIVVNELPAIGDSSKIYLLPEADGEEPNRFGEYVFIEGAWERIGSAGVEVNLDEYVKNTNFATKDGVGVVKVNSSYGIYAMADGTLYTLPASQDVINQKKSTYNPIVPLTLDYAVKNSLTTNTIELTDEEKANACSWLGAAPKEEWITLADYTLAEDTERVLVTEDINGNAFRCKKARVILKMNGEFSQSGYTTWISFGQENIYQNSCRLALGTTLNGTNQVVYADNEIIANVISKGMACATAINGITRAGNNSYIGCIEISLNNGIPLPAGLSIKVEGIRA